MARPPPRTVVGPAPVVIEEIGPIQLGAGEKGWRARPGRQRNSPKGVSRMVTAGIDIGHESVTVVILHEGGTLGHATFVISGEVGAASTLAFEQTLDRLGIARASVNHIFATGMGRANVALADGHRTPMLSHARGAHWWFPGARTVIDAGAEGSRVMRCDAKGTLTSFALNDNCAAGSGVFLETVADMLDVPLADMGGLALRGSRRVVLTSTCAVFAESEIVAEIHRGSSRADILLGGSTSRSSPRSPP